MMNSMSFAKGVGVGLVIGSAIGMVVNPPASKKPAKKSNVVGRAVKTVGDMIENISDSLSM